MLDFHFKVTGKLGQIREYANLHDMKVNHKKTKIIPFNFSRKYDFLPKLEYDGHLLEVEYTCKLLGVMIDSSGRWNEHICRIYHEKS